MRTIASHERPALDRRAKWAESIIERGRQAGPLPVYGSDEWAALSTTDPRFVASVAVAAECWRDAGTPETIRRTAELEIMAAEQVTRGERSAAFAELAGSVRALASIPTQTELATRRAVVSV